MGTWSTSKALEQNRHNTATSSEKIELLTHLIQRVTVHPTRIEIAVKVDAIGSSDAVASATGQIAMLQVSVELKRSGMGLRLIVQAPGETTVRGSDGTLVALVAKAHDWFARLISGRSGSIQAIADEEKVTISYVTRVIYIAFMDPAIVSRILEGDHPTELNAKRLMKILPLPLAWDDQWVVVGMSR